MRAGRASEAEAEFQRLVTTYPQFAGPAINLGILHRKAGRLEKAEEALREAVDRNESAVALTELGVVLRMRGQFKEAVSAYERALAIDPEFAPAYRNLGVVLDLYVGDAEGALEAFEEYKRITGEDKPVSGWIAELRQRTGKPVAPPRPKEPEGEPQDSQSEPASTPGSPEEGEPQNAPADPGAEPAPDASPPESTPEPAAEPQRAGE